MAIRRGGEDYLLKGGNRRALGRQRSSRKGEPGKRGCVNQSVSRSPVEECECLSQCKGGLNQG